MVKRRMEPEDEIIASMLHRQLDDDSVDSETKIMIIKWFDSFDYTDLSKLTTTELLCRHADNLHW